jgi:hypothetical protein
MSEPFIGGADGQADLWLEPTALAGALESEPQLPASAEAIAFVVPAMTLD